MIPAEKQDIENEIDSLNNQAWLLRVNNSQQTFLLSKEASELSRSIGYEKGLAAALRTYGFAHIRLSKIKEAEIILEEALLLMKSLNDVQGQSDVYEYLGIVYRSFGNFEASLQNLDISLVLRQETKYLEGISLSNYHLGVTYKYLGDFDKALNCLFQSLSVAREIQSKMPESYALNLIGQIYFETGDFEQSLNYYRLSLELRKVLGDKWGEAGSLDNIGYTYFKLGFIDEAIHHCSQSLAICSSINDKKGEANVLFHLAEINKYRGNSDVSIEAAKNSLLIRKEIGDKKGQAELLLFIAEVCKHPDDIFTLLNEALLIGNDIKAVDLLSKIYFSFYLIYKRQLNFEQALVNLENYNKTEKQLHKDTLAEKISNLDTTHRAEQAKKETEIFRLRNIELAEMFEQMKIQKTEIELQKKLLEQSLDELKSAQYQLIQAEKMASLGELTAGIAHEIQNPLNFVNNFSEVNTELIDELKSELAWGNTQQAIEIADDIKENEQKINHHGKRADAIVKGMLQHSRTNSGQKEPTDINALTDEYLRLAYHGLRAKDNNFNATLQTDYDESIGNINIIPQDIGRVVLNLITNAFYAVNERSQKEKDSCNNTYQPTITVTTKKSGDSVQIIIKDNGNGIPQKVLDKIFQPFFTTKPTGEGTGLGLSLSYDIVKAHSGELKVETREGVGSEFIIKMPVI